VRDEARRRARRARPVAPDTLADAADRNGYAGPATYISHPRCSHATMAHNAAHSPDAIGVTDDHDRRALRAALDGLDDDDRLIVDMRHVGGMSFKQIADWFGCPLGTALARHHRALAKLRSAMQATLGRAETAGDAADASTSTGASR
jgi:RNA polymerase sigma factor (sigma-70 family)